MRPWNSDSDRWRLLDEDAVAGILPLRVMAYLVDLCVIGVLGLALWVLVHLLIVMSFGLLAFLAGPLSFLAILYHTALVGGPSAATIGMRVMGIETIGRDGERPSYVEAGVQAILFYASMAISHLLILLVPLIDGRRRMLHDMATGLLLVRRWRGAVPRNVASRDFA